MASRSHSWYGPFVKSSQQRISCGQGFASCLQPAEFGRRVDIVGKIAYCSPLFAESELENAAELRCGGCDLQSLKTWRLFAGSINAMYLQWPGGCRVEGGSALSGQGQTNRRGRCEGHRLCQSVMCCLGGHNYIGHNYVLARRHSHVQRVEI